MDLCPGHIGRGTGERCCVCRRPIPPALRRAPGSLSDLNNGCPLCHAGAPHVEHAVAASA